MEELLCQAPEGLSKEIIEDVFNKNDKQVLPALMELWNIKEKSLKEKTKWDDIRETCDAFDKEMQEVFMSKLKRK